MKVIVRMRSHAYYEVTMPDEADLRAQVRETVERIVGSEGQGVLTLQDGESRWLTFRTREIEVVEIETGDKF